MAGGGSATMANSGSVLIVVAGDRGTGKTSLIVTTAVDKFLTSAPPLMPPTKLPLDCFPDQVPLTIIDTSSRFPPLLPLSLSLSIYIYILFLFLFVVRFFWFALFFFELWFALLYLCGGKEVKDGFFFNKR